MQVEITKLTDESLLRAACSSTTGRDSQMSLKTAYRLGHSIIRTQLFWIRLVDIPTFVSTHLVRHSVGVTHFVKSNRDDRNPLVTTSVNAITRDSPVEHCMLINAEALINMAHKRLCGASHVKTRQVMLAICDKMHEIDPYLVKHLIPICEYRNGICSETRCCGHNQSIGME